MDNDHGHDADKEQPRPEELSDRERNELIQHLSDLSQRGYQLLKEGFVDQAIDQFAEILTYDPDNNYALVGLGDAERKRRHFHDAIKHYERCLSVYPQNNYALFGLADCYKSIRMYNRAIEVWEQYLKLDDNNVTVLTRVADAYRKVKNLRRSREIYLRALEVEKDNAYALIGLGHLLYEFRDYQGAISYFRRIHEIDGPRVDIRVLTSIGNCYRKLKQYDKGRPFFEEALERDSGNFYAHFGLADCFRGLNRPQDSLVHWNAILAKDPKNKVILTRAGDAYRSMGEIPTAVEYYQKALKIEYDVYAVLGLAIIQKEEGQVDQAIVALEEAIRVDPKNARLYLELASCHETAGDAEAATQVLQRFQSHGAKHPAVSERLARLSRRR